MPSLILFPRLLRNGQGRKKEGEWQRSSRSSFYLSARLWAGLIDSLAIRPELLAAEKEKYLDCGLRARAIQSANTAAI